MILGILAAIAIPAFFDQRDKALDADAKVQARTAEGNDDGTKALTCTAPGDARCPTGGDWSGD